MSRLCKNFKWVLQDLGNVSSSAVGSIWFGGHLVTVTSSFRITHKIFSTQKIFSKIWWKEIHLLFFETIMEHEKWIQSRTHHVDLIFEWVPFLLRIYFAIAAKHGMIYLDWFENMHTFRFLCDLKHICWPESPIKEYRL